MKRHFVFLLFISFGAFAKTPDSSRVSVIRSIEVLKERIKQDSLQQFVLLKTYIPNIIIDLRYATNENCCRKPIYTNPSAWLRKIPAQKLKMAQAELNKIGLTLKIYDAYRPYRHTLTIWQLSSDRHYTANPRKGSNHNRGIAIDVTLADLKTGKELNMGTPFDSFTDTAHHDFHQLSAFVLANRRLLQQTLRKYGFTHVPTEWWHYQYKALMMYDVVDIDFDDLNK